MRSRLDRSWSDVTCAYPFTDLPEHTAVFAFRRNGIPAHSLHATHGGAALMMTTCLLGALQHILSPGPRRCRRLEQSDLLFLT